MEIITDKNFNHKIAKGVVVVDFLQIGVDLVV